MAGYYKILGIEKSASQADIKNAYRKLSKKFHPDKNDGDAFFENMFKQIQEAYETLGNEEKRKGYDCQFESEDTANKSNSQKTYTHYQSPPQQPKSQEQSHSEPQIKVPVIDEFRADQLYFNSGDVINFEWKTHNADIVRIKPFGIVDLNGAKSYKLKLKKENQESIKITIEATNFSSGKTAIKNIELKNKLFNVPHTPQGFQGEAPIETNSSFYINYFTSEGRLRRSSYLLRAFLLSFTLAGMVTVVEGARDSEVLIFSAFAILVCVFQLAIQTIKRLHDTNYSGWHVVWSIVPLACVLLGLHALFTKGTPGPNKYGGDPRMKLAQ